MYFWRQKISFLFPLSIKAIWPFVSETNAWCFSPCVPPLLSSAVIPPFRFDCLFSSKLPGGNINGNVNGPHLPGQIACNKIKKRVIVSVPLSWIKVLLRERAELCPALGESLSQLLLLLLLQNIWPRTFPSPTWKRVSTWGRSSNRWPGRPSCRRRWRTTRTRCHTPLPVPVPVSTRWTGAY